MKSWVVALSIVVAAEASASPLDKPWFTATPSELITLGSGVQETAILRDDLDASFDDRGRYTRRSRRVFVVRTQKDTENWSYLTAGYHASRHARPTLRARAIHPDGKVVELDPKQVTDAAATVVGPVSSDLRELEAVLPALQIGTIVEQEVIIAEREATIGGTFEIVEVGHGYVPARSVRVTISAPTALAIQYTSRNVAVKPRRESKGTRTTWSWELGPLDPTPDRDAFAPADTIVEPIIAFSTAKSWNAVAREYRTLTDRTIAPFAWPAEVPRTATLATVRTLTAWLHRQVRYDGIQLAETTMIPSAPADTLKRGHGSVVDKALVLLAALRELRIPSELVMISAAPGTDVLREVPALNTFDHVLVRTRIAGREVWIDPYAVFVVPGRLPQWSQGRRALVIANETQALVETPRAKADENFAREVRVFDAAEVGAATRITENVKLGGAFEDSFRAWLSDVGDATESFTGYVKDEYLSDAFEKYSVSHAADLDKPLALTLSASKPRRVRVDGWRLAIELFPSDTFDKARSVIQLDAERDTDFVWETPHVYEIENRISIPPGYTAPKPVRETVLKLGTATLREQQRLEGRTLVVAYRFETGKVRLTPKELATLVGKLREVDDKPVRFLLEHTGHALSAQHKPREALAEIDRLIALHPTEALHHIERSRVLVAAGMGTAARRAARKAVDLEPKNPDAHLTVARALWRDSFGIDYGFDHDRAGAIAAYRKAIEIAPSYLNATIGLAQLLERDLAGQRYDVGADVRGAVEAWRTARMLARTDNEVGAGLAEALLVTGDFAGAELVARSMTPDETRDALLLAAIAGGTQRGRTTATADSLASGTARITRLDRAAAYLETARAYDGARALHAITKSTRASKIATLARSPVKPDLADPKAVLIESLHVAADPTYPANVFWDRELEEEIRLAARAASGLVDHGPFGDALWSHLDVRSEALAPGLVRAELSFQGSPPTTAYLVKDRGALKLLAFKDWLPGAGRYASKLAQSSNASVVKLLEAIRNDTRTTNSPVLKAVGEIWDTTPRESEAVALVIALLAGEPSAVLERCPSRAPSARAACDQVLAAALAKADRWSELVTHTTEWVAREPNHTEALRAHVNALAAERRFADAQKAIDASSIDADTLTKFRGQLAATRGDFAAAVVHADVLANKPNPAPQALNEAAWNRLLTGKDFAKAREQAIKALGGNRQQAPLSILNTLAAIEAELGNLHAAVEAEHEAIAKMPMLKTRASTWYVMGRVAEQLGLREDAIAWYRMIGTTHRGMADSDELARRRLAKLKP